MELTDSQIETLKRLAIGSLGIGVSIPLIKELTKPEVPLTLPSSSGTGVSVPVTKDDMQSSITGYKRKRNRKVDSTVKELQNYDPAKNIQEKRSEFDWKDLLNPLYLPAVTAAVAAPGIAGHYLASKILEHKNKSDAKEDMDASKEEFAKAMFEANSNRLNRDIKAHKPSSQVAKDIYGTAKSLAGKAVGAADSALGKSSDFINEKILGPMLKSSESSKLLNDFYNDLEKLASYSIEKTAQQPIMSGRGGVGYSYNPNNPTGSLAGAAQPPSQTPSQSSEGIGFWDIFNPNTYLEALKKYFPAYVGSLAATGLIGLGAGTYYGHRAAKREDKDTPEAYKYLSEFLRRQQEQGTPVYATPKPVEKNKKPWYSID